MIFGGLTRRGYPLLSRKGLPMKPAAETSTGALQ
jgi:hypothetical protein